VGVWEEDQQANRGSGLSVEKQRDRSRDNALPADKNANWLEKKLKR